jgi:hypothetical protein
MLKFRKRNLQRDETMGNGLSVITGGKGYVGFALVKEFEARGEKMRLLLRTDSPYFDGIHA